MPPAPANAGGGAGGGVVAPVGGAGGMSAPSINVNPGSIGGGGQVNTGTGA